MKIYKAAIIGLGPSGLSVNKLIYNGKTNDIIAFDKSNFYERNNFFGFWLTEWMKPFESLVEKKWDNWSISNNETEIVHSDKNNPYCVISFRKWKEYCLNTSNRLDIKNKKVIKYSRINNYYKIITEDQKEYFAEKIYDSRYSKQKKQELVQHFFGINIITSKKIFDENKLTLMHFTEEEDLLHFIYVLPFEKNKALVESTVFSKTTFDEMWYRTRIKNYLKKLEINEFKEISIETGVIPMFDAFEKPTKDNNIFNIGIRGGACKASTGYAFSFLIKQVQLLKKTNKNYVNVHSFIETKMDNIFLNYLKKNNENGSSFVNLAKNLTGREFQSFMMGKSSIYTKLKIINSMPKLAFIKAAIK